MLQWHSSRDRTEKKNLQTLMNSVLSEVYGQVVSARHGQNGEGMGAFPKLAGQTSDYISDRLYAYKNREQIGAMSSTMWAQAGMLSDK